MIVLTVFMILGVLVLLPLRVSANFEVDFALWQVKMRAKVFFVPIFREEMRLDGYNLHCNGSVNTTVNITKMDGSIGLALLKAIVWDSIDLTLFLNYAKLSPFVMVVSESALGMLGAIGGLATHVRVKTTSGFALRSGLSGRVVVSVSLAEVVLALIKDAVSRHKKQNKAQKRRWECECR